MISVIMPVYNVGSYIGEAIESILNQTENDFELIIIDDASTDNTLKKVKKYAVIDKRIKVIKLKNNKGAAAARNAGLDIAQGEFIVLMDGDDISLPTRFEMLLKGFTSESIGFTHSDMVLINEEGVPYSTRHFFNIQHYNIPRYFLKEGSPFCAASLMIRRSALGELRYDENLRIGEDTDMIYSLTKTTLGNHVPSVLYMYRRHATNTTVAPTYAEFIIHIQKFLDMHEYNELVPEAKSLVTQMSIVALFIFRRGLPIIAENILSQASRIVKNSEDELFVRGIGSLAIGEYKVAITNLESMKNKDHITYNYIGEAYGYLGNTEKAYTYFKKSLKNNKNYQEPIENIKSLGGSNLTIADIAWRKYLK